MLTLALLAALTAAPGDILARYVSTPDEAVALDTGERTKVVAAAKVVWPSLIPANTTAVSCHRPGGGPTVTCAGSEETVPTDDELLQMVVNGTVSNRSEQRLASVEGIAPSVWAAFALDAFGDISTIYSFKVWRDPEAPALVWAQVWRIKTESPTDWRQDYDAGLVVMTLSRLVEE